MRGGFRPPSERVDVDYGELVGGRLDDISIVMRLDEIGPIDRRSSGGRERGRFEGLADRLEDLPDRCRVGDEGDESDVARGALQWKLLADAGEEFGPGNSGGVVGGTGSGCAAVGACPSCPADGDRHLFLRNTSQSPPGDSARTLRGSDACVSVAAGPGRQGG